MGYVYFDGGELDGRVYDVDSLMSTDAVVLPIQQYRWTQEKKHSTTSSNVAQIWRHESMFAPDGTPLAQPAEAAPVAPSAPAPATVPAPPPVPGSESPAPAPVPAAPSVDPTPEQPAAEEAPAAQTVGDDGDTDGESLLARRKALKLGRKEISDASGLAQSKIASIENGTGKRTKPEEIAALANTLAQFESKAVGV